MNLMNSISLFLIMLTLAAIPSTSVALVVTRSATLGISNGIAVSLGVVLGDLVFIILAVLGLAVIAETMGSFFLVIKCIGGAYLIWLGYSLITTKHKITISLKDSNSTDTLLTSFLAGFFLTLGDIKAIFFYASLFPTFIDLASLNVSDILTIISVTIITVGGVKVAYAFSAIKVINMSRGLHLENVAKKTAGSFMLGAGSYLIIKASLS